MLRNSNANAPCKQSRWYFGGMAGAFAATCTHPLDLLKVHLITQQGQKMGIVTTIIAVIESDGFFALYNGISASIFRQLTYSTTRFGVYEWIKNQRAASNKQSGLFERIIIAAVAGFTGGIVGNPGDMVNVRMQYDMKIAFDARRNYKHVADGIVQVYRHEGISALMNGVTMTASRAAMVTIGQLAFYDTFKQIILSTLYFHDNILTHFSASVGAATVATLLTQPFDVMKTRLMNAKPGQYAGLLTCATDISKNGPQGFFKGTVPAFIRMGPHTILTLMLLEQLKKHFGIVPTRKNDNIPSAST